MLTLKQGMKLSAIVDKMGLKITDPKASAEQLGADLVMQFVSKAHKAEQEIYAFVAETKGCSIKEAEQVNLVEFIQGLLGDPAVASFFRSAAS